MAQFFLWSPHWHGYSAPDAEAALWPSSLSIQSNPALLLPPTSPRLSPMSYLPLPAHGPPPPSCPKHLPRRGPVPLLFPSRRLSRRLPRDLPRRALGLFPRRPKPRPPLPKKNNWASSTNTTQPDISTLNAPDGQDLVLGPHPDMTSSRPRAASNRALSYVRLTRGDD